MMNVHSASWLVPIASPPIRDGAVALDENGRVTAIGTLRELQSLGPVVRHEGVLMPGLVNAHAHVELSGMSGAVPGGDGLAPWIGRLLATRRSDDAGAIAEAARSLVARGTVAIADVSNGGGAAGSLRAAGLALVDLHEQLSPRGAIVPTRAGAIPTAHATYTCSGAALRAIAARSGGRLVSIHVEEDASEAELLRDGSGALAALLAERGFVPDGVPCGRRPIAWLESLGVLGEGTLLVHLVSADDESLALAARRGAIAVLCPRSNLHIGARLPSFRRIRASGLQVALGSDSLASSPSLDVLADVAVLAQAGADPAWLLHAATLGGARALGLPQFGALAIGRRPGVIRVGAGAVHDPIAFVAHDGAHAPVERVDAPLTVEVSA
jgi:cytosine/adenosine deaminase-related metal-dependent hydrolase